MERESKSKDNVYSTIRNFYLMHSREFHSFPSEEETKNTLKIFLGKDIGRHKINLRELETDVIKQRIEEISKQEKDVSKEKLESILGVKLSDYDLSDRLVKDEIKKDITPKRMGRRTFETNKQAYNAVYNVFLKHSKSKHEFPKVKNVEADLKIHMSTYGIKIREIKLKVIKQRLKEIYGQGLDPPVKEIGKLLGIGIFRYVDDLGFENFSKLRESYVGKKTRRKFVTKEEALSSLRKEVKELIFKGGYKDKGDTQKRLGTSIATYNIRWKEEILYPVYGEIIKEELEKNPKIGDRKIKQKYSFAQSFLNNQGSFVEFKVKNNIPISKVEEKKLLRRLILQALKPKPEPPTTEECIWNLIKQKTEKSYDTFRILKEIEYLKRINKIEGSILENGYWRVE